MPLEIRTKDEFSNLLEKATEVRVVKGKDDSAKVKLRTPKGLYTYKTTMSEAQNLTKGLKTPIIDY